MEHYQTDEAIFMTGDDLKFTVASCVCSDTGRVRENNEDNFLLRTVTNARQQLSVQITDRVESDDWAGWQCFGVFDGMGGGEKGEWASLTAASVLGEEFGRRPLLTASRKDIDDLIRNTFMRINGLIVNEQSRSDVYGTTATVVATDGEVFKIYHAGDSRAYLMRDQSLFRLTEDQTLAAMKVEMGVYEEDDPRAERDKHLLTVYLGYDENGDKLVPQESEWMRFEKGDRLLLCSDGLYDMVTDPAISRIMRETETAEEAAGELCDLALAAGGVDNVTCLVLEAQPPA